MSLIKCSKCGKEYDGFYIHICEKEGIEKKGSEKQKWEVAPGFKKIFMYDPRASHITRIISFFLLFPSTGIFAGIPLFIQEVIIEGKNEMAATYLYAIGIGILSLLISYGLSHLKKWSLFLYGVFIIIIFLITRGTILFGFTGIAGLILVFYFDNKKFR